MIHVFNAGSRIRLLVWYNNFFFAVFLFYPLNYLRVLHYQTCFTEWNELWTAGIQMKWRCDHRSCYRNLSKVKFKRSTLKNREDFQGFNGTQTRCLCVRAAVLYQLNYEDPYMHTWRAGQFIEHYNRHLHFKLASIKTPLYYWRIGPITTQHKYALRTFHYFISYHRVPSDHLTSYFHPPMTFLCSIFFQF